MTRVLLTQVQISSVAEQDMLEMGLVMTYDGS